MVNIWINVKYFFSFKNIFKRKLFNAVAVDLEFHSIVRSIMYDKTIKKDGRGYKFLISTVIKYNVKVECEKVKIYIYNILHI